MLMEDWKFWDKRLDSYERISHLDRVLVTSERGNRHSVAFVRNEGVFSNTCIIIGLSTLDAFSCLQSSLHEEWCRRFGGAALRTDMSYSAKTCFETFPLAAPASSDLIRRLQECGHEYNLKRSRVMLDHGEGLTTTFNRLHDPDETSENIDKLRELHVEMDQAVAAAYDWTDIDLGHGFHETKQGIRFTISEPARREVLQRLLKLNHERYAEEVKQGLHSKKRAAKKTAPKKKAANKPAKEESTLFDLGEDE